MSFISTAPIGIASVPPLASASALKTAVCRACCGMNTDGVLSAPRPVITHATISFRYAAARTNNRAVSTGRAYDSSVAHTVIVAAHTSMRAIARPTSPRFSASTMNGKLASVLRNGTRIGIESTRPRA